MYTFTKCFTCIILILLLLVVVVLRYLLIILCHATFYPEYSTSYHCPVLSKLEESLTLSVYTFIAINVHSINPYT